jgi:hypothetical protein
VRRAGGGLPVFLKGYVLAGSGILIALLIIYTQQVIGRMNNQVEILSGLIARFCALATFPALENPESQEVFRSIVRQVDFPIVITDAEGRPRAWRGIGISSDAVAGGAIATADLDDPTGVIADLMSITRRLDEQRPPVAMHDPASGDVVGYVHYGEWSLIRQLRFIPFAQIGIVALFVAIGYWTYRNIKLSEQHSIWVGMARETAHQLGTPLSSLMGWLELIRERPPEAEESEHSLSRVAEEMDRDVSRLSRIASRFGNIGSIPNLKSQDIVPIVSDAVRYIRTRLPRGGRKVEVVENYEDVPHLNINGELLGWAVENLLVNSVDSMDKPSGKIEVAVSRRRETETVEIWIRDNGKGMESREMKRAFRPGYSTKKRGWGLGLTLARRIVEEYHGGRIWIDSSRPGEGTLFRIAFPV